jgi:PAS domain S-box-containing protein
MTTTKNPFVYHSPDAISRLSMDGVFLMVNPKVPEFMGIPEEVIVGKTNRQLGIPSEICDQVDQDLDWVTRHQQKTCTLFTYQGRHFESVMIPEFTENNELTSVISYTRDVTDREELNRYLRQQLSYTRNMINSIPLPVVVLDSDLRLQFSNPAFLETYQKTEEEIYEQFVFALLSFQEANLEAIETSLHRIILDEQGDELELEVTLLVTDQGCRHVRLHASRIAHLNYILLTIYDITSETEQVSELENDLKQRNQELTFSYEKLKSLMLELSTTEDRERRYLSDLLHDDVQQLLAGLGFQLKEIAAKTDSKEIGHLLKQSQELLSTIIQVTRELSHDLCPLETSTKSFLSIVQSLCRQMETLHGLTVQLHLPEELEVPDGTIRSILLKALKEILFNIAKHADVDEASLYLQETEELFEVRIQDHGKGFNVEEILQRPQKTGLGLFTLQERLSSVGGNLEIESTPETGSFFQLTVPNEVTPPISEDPPSLEQSLGTEGDQQIRVVLVDDHSILRQALSTYLDTYKNVKVVGQAADGKEGVQVVNDTLPDVVLMDIAMPEMSGAEATKLITSTHPEIRVVGLSMFPREDLVESLRDIGMDTLLSKTALLSEVYDALIGMKE